MATYTQSASNATYTPTGTVDRQNQGIYITGTSAPVGEYLTMATLYINVQSTTNTEEFSCLHQSSSHSTKATSSNTYTFTSTGEKVLEFTFNGSSAIAENDYILVRNCNTSTNPRNWYWYIEDGGSSSPPFTNMIWSQQQTGTCTAPSQDNKSSKNAKFIVETSSSPPPSSSGVLNPPQVAYI